MQRISGVKSLVSIPITSENKVIGAICFGKKHTENFNIELPLLKLFAEDIGISIENAKKYRNLQNTLEQFK